MSTLNGILDNPIIKSTIKKKVEKIMRENNAKAIALTVEDDGELDVYVLHRHPTEYEAVNKDLAAANIEIAELKQFIKENIS